jgi:uncharacterized protein (TIGR02271 family)
VAEDEARSQVIPIFEEKLRVDKVEREADRLLIKTSIKHRTEYADIELHRADATIERIMINRFVEAAPPIRQEGDTVVVSVVEEIMVVEKRLLLKEEIRIHQQHIVQHLHQPVVLRSEECRLNGSLMVPSTPNRKRLIHDRYQRSTAPCWGGL